MNTWIKDGFLRSIIGKEWQPPFDDHSYYYTKERKHMSFEIPTNFLFLRPNVIDFSSISSPTVQSMFLTEYVIYRGFNCVLNPLNFSVNRFGKQFHRKSKFKWISRNYWKEEYWFPEKGICERELRENKIRKNSYRFRIGVNRKNCNNDI